MPMSADEIRAQMDRATALYTARQWKEASDLFTELLIEPEALSGANEMHWNTAMCFAHLGDLDLALQHVEAGGYSTDDFHHDFARSTFDFTAALFEQGQWAEAADGFTELLLLPGLPADRMDEVHWDIGLCFAHLGDWDRAFGHLRAQGGDEAAFRQTCERRGLTPPAADSGQE